MEDYSGGYSGGFDAGMGYSEGCIPMDNVGFSGSEVIGNQLPTFDNSGVETITEVPDATEDIDSELGDVKMPKMKFKKPKYVKPKTNNQMNVWNTVSNNSGTCSIVVGCLIGIAIFVLLYIFVIRD